MDNDHDSDNSRSTARGERSDAALESEVDDDAALVQAARAGDAAAFADLLERHYNRIHGLAFRLTGSAADADDLTQDVCTALPRKLAGFRGDARFGTWLYRVVVNAAHDRRRRQKTHAEAAAAWGERERATRLELAEARQRREWLIEAMQGLGDDLRDTLALCLAGLTQAEAARVLDVAEGTVSWRMAEARKQLRRIDEEQQS
ncbi:MAG: RNA polymerase subunit sigma-70 [Gammaproteobacteria bacterium]|nr:MAG: RNA polymerase subunit sigma-70 [Gammaproteobacteria bacterium]